MILKLCLKLLTFFWISERLVIQFRVFLKTGIGQSIFTLSNPSHPKGSSDCKKNWATTLFYIIIRVNSRTSFGCGIRYTETSRRETLSYIKWWVTITWTGTLNETVYEVNNRLRNPRVRNLCDHFYPNKRTWGGKGYSPLRKPPVTRFLLLSVRLVWSGGYVLNLGLDWSDIVDLGSVGVCTLCLYLRITVYRKT